MWDESTLLCLILARGIDFSNRSMLERLIFLLSLMGKHRFFPTYD